MTANRSRRSSFRSLRPLGIGRLRALRSGLRAVLPSVATANQPVGATVRASTWVTASYFARQARVGPARMSFSLWGSNPALR